MRKIAIVGPESSGKSTLAEAVALRLGAGLVTEAARDFLDDLGRPYAEPDLLAIAMAQAANEDMVAAAPGGSGIVICDTDLITIRVWSEEKYGRCDPWIMEQSEKRRYDLWLLCAPDMPWEPDPLRENPHDRDRLFQVYLTMLEELRKPYAIIAGDRQARLLDALDAIDRTG